LSVATPPLVHPTGNTPVIDFLTGIGTTYNMDGAKIRTVVENLNTHGNYMVSQLKDSPRALVEEASRPIAGLYAVIAAFIAADDEGPHAFSEPARPEGLNLSRPTGGPCGNDLTKQLDMNPCAPAGITMATTRVMGLAKGILDDVVKDRKDQNTPISRRHLKALVRNMAYMHIFLFGCMYMTTPVEGDRGDIPPAYTLRCCRLVVEFFEGVGFADKNVTMRTVFDKVVTRVHLTAPIAAPLSPLTSPAHHHPTQDHTHTHPTSPPTYTLAHLHLHLHTSTPLPAPLPAPLTTLSPPLCAHVSQLMNLRQGLKATSGDAVIKFSPNDFAREGVQRIRKGECVCPHLLLVV
jgi:hypothetical protein